MKDPEEMGAKQLTDALFGSPGGSGGQLIYRGATIASLNGDEFQDNAIDGEGYDVWYMSIDDVPPRGDVLANRVPESIPGEVDRHEVVSVTGGLTSRIGTGVFFAQQREALPLVLYFHRERIEGDIFPIEYSYRWFDNHPGVLAHADTRSSGEVYVNGDLTGLVTQDVNEAPTVTVWKENIENRATSNTISKERETVAVAPEINLDRALEFAASWYLQPGGVIPNMKTVLAAQPGFTTKTHVARHEESVNVTMWDDEQIATALYDVALNRMNYDPDEYWIIVTTRQLAKDAKTLNPNRFEFAFNGEEIVRSVRDVPDALLG